MTNEEIIATLGNAIGPAAIKLVPVMHRLTLEELVAVYEKHINKDRDGVMAAIRDKMTNEEAADNTVGMGLLFGKYADDNLARKKAVDEIGWIVLKAAFSILLTAAFPF